MTAAQLTLELDAPTTPPREWNPRYVAYATAHGRGPEAMLAHDKEESPGGCMVEFMLWISGRWREWRKLRGRPDRWDYASDRDQQDFDVFVGADRATETNRRAHD